MSVLDECPICYETYADPRTLPCGHSFCQGCIISMTHGGRISCPTDRRDFSVPAGGFSVNYALRELLEQRNLPNATPLQPTAPPIPERPATPVNAYVIDAQRPERPATPVNIYVIDAQSERIEEDCPRKFRKGLYETLQSLMDDDQERKRSMIIVAAMLIMTFVRFVAGAAKLSSDCGKERNVAVYLFVKSWPGFVFWFMILLLVYKKKVGRAFKNWFFEIYFAINTLFAFVWLIVGCVWTFGGHKEIRDDCPLIYSGYSDHFINFAIFLTSVDLCVCFVVLMLLIFVGCFESNDCI